MPPKNEFKVRDFKHVRTLGTGGEGTVELVTSPTGEKFALKFMYTSLFDDVRREFNTIKNVESRHVVRYYRFFDLRKNPYRGFNVGILMEYVDGLDLFDTIRFIDTPEDQRFRMFVKAAHDIFHGLADLEVRGIVHRDIKPENIVMEGLEPRFVIVDFGLGCRLKPQDATNMVACSLKDKSGTPSNYSPQRAEVNLHKRVKLACEGARKWEYDYHKDDVWSVGTVLAFIFTKKRGVECDFPAQCERMLLEPLAVQATLLDFKLSHAHENLIAQSFLKRLTAPCEADRITIQKAVVMADIMFEKQFIGEATRRREKPVYPATQF